MEKEMPAIKIVNKCLEARNGGCVVTNTRPEKAGLGSQQHQADLVPHS
jgi:hypothetical protein